MRARALLLAAVLGLAPSYALAQADPQEGVGPPPGYEDQAPPPEAYDDSLAPYGSWQVDSTYGRVWHPAVAAGWQPYADGQWAWSPYGWTWVSYEPWAWTFHYGRWVWVPVYGWSWVPGYVWGPAWVDWYWGDGYVGWAPLSPFATHVAVFDHFVFVHERDFCAHRLRPTFFVHGRGLDPVVHNWRRRDFRAPDRDRIERVSRHPIQRVDRRPPGTVAPRGDRRLARPGTNPNLGRARRGEGFGRLDDGRGAVRPRQNDAGRGFDRPRANNISQPAAGQRLARPQIDPDLGSARNAPVFVRPGDPPSGLRSQRVNRPQASGRVERGWSRPTTPGVSRPTPPTVSGGTMMPSQGRGMYGGVISRGGAERGHAGGGGRYSGGATSGFASGVR